MEEYLKVVDGVLMIAEFVSKKTPTLRDDEFIALVKSYREKLRPIFGAPDGVEQADPIKAAEEVIAEAGQ